MSEIQFKIKKCVILFRRGRLAQFSLVKPPILGQQWNRQLSEVGRFNLFSEKMLLTGLKMIFYKWISIGERIRWPCSKDNKAHLIVANILFFPNHLPVIVFTVTHTCGSCTVVSDWNVYISHCLKCIGTIKSTGGWRWRTAQTLYSNLFRTKEKPGGNRGLRLSGVLLYVH